MMVFLYSGSIERHGFVAEFFCSSLVAPQVMGERWLMMDCSVDVGYVAFDIFRTVVRHSKNSRVLL